MSTAVIRTRKNLLGEYPPEIQKISLDYLLNHLGMEINLRPIYQRHIRWTPSAMNDFIGTIMNNGLVPGLIMYQLSESEKIDEKQGKSYEMVDGQHRLFTLLAFRESTFRYLPHIKKGFIVYWDYQTILENGEIQHSQVFYQQTNEVEQFCHENNFTPQYLTAEEKAYFDRFSVSLTLIRSKLSLNQRREIFMSLQKGIPVRNSDFLKNKTDCKLVSFMSENGYQEMMTDTFLPHCYKNAANYWVHWVCRCFLLYKRFRGLCRNADLNKKPVSETFLIEDKQIKKLIEMNSPEFNPRTDEEATLIHDFDDVFRTFIAFLKRFEEHQKLNPTQIFALFYVLCDETKDIDIILSHIWYLSKEGNSKTKKNLWESRDEREPRRQYFNRCFNQLSSITERALPYDDRNISKALRKLVWDKCEDGLCTICEDEISLKDFEAGHIVARALGGQGTIDNLIPICFFCNRDMGTKNAWEYKKDMYPEFNNEFILS